MMTMRMLLMHRDQLLVKWNSAGTRVGGYTRVDAAHPLEFYIGYDESGLKSLLLVSPAEMGQPASSKSIQARFGQRVDGRWALTLRLSQVEQEEVFVQLCSDLMECSRGQPGDESGIAFVLNRYRRWLKLMERQGSGLLGESARRGLLGEVLFLGRLLHEALPPLDAVGGWMGSEGADRDFVLANGWYEIKTVGVGAKHVRISSLEQLDAPTPGALQIYFVDRAAPNEPESFSLNSVIRDLRVRLKQDPAAVELFEAKLLDAGYLDLQDYELPLYRLHGAQRYRCDERFPRLTKQSVPPQVTAASYELSLSTLSEWRVE